MRDLDRLSRATTVDDVVREVLEHFDSGSELFSIDHEFACMVRVGDPTDVVKLAGDFREAMLRSQGHFDGRRTWIPLPERNQVVYVVAEPGNRTHDVADNRTWGAVLSGHRRRFEDLERQRRRTEMAVAAELQWDVLPVRADTLGPYRVAGILEPAYEVAGDVFDYAMADGAVWAYSFDGMGHGLDAAMTSVLVLSAVRNARREGASLSEQMALANDVLWRQYEGDRFVTGAACRLDDDGFVEIVNAGHEPVRTVVGGRARRLDIHADVPLGVRPDVDFAVQSVATLAHGDGIVMFSDGPAAQSSFGERYGDDHLDDMLTRKWSDVPLQTGHDVIGDVIDFIGDGRIEDDITAVVICRDVGEAGSVRCP